MKCSKLVGCTILLGLVLIAVGLQPTQARPCSLLHEKSRWPELVGVPGCKAAAIIKRESKHVDVIVVPVHGPVPGDIRLRCDRVLVGIDHTGAVAVTPIVG